MSKIPNINCKYYTTFGKCTNKNYSKWLFNKECKLLDRQSIVCHCEFQSKHPKPPAPPPPPKRKITEDVSYKDIKNFFWTKEEKIYGDECFVVASSPYIEKAIGVFPDIREAVELRDNKNKSIGLNAFKIYPALISIDKTKGE